MRCYVLMGVSGCGKSSVDTALQVLCDIDFVDGDDLHPRANIAKMACGVPLDDRDRDPWLAEVDIARPYADVIAHSETYLRETMI